MSVRDEVIGHIRRMSRTDLVVFILMVGHVDNVTAMSVDKEAYRGKVQLRLTTTTGHVNFPYKPVKEL